MTSLVSDSFSCMFEVLAMYDPNSQEYTDLSNDFGSLYYTKNMGLWVTESDLEEAHAFCQEDAFSIGTDYCMSTMAMLSTAAVSYGDANYKEAVDGNFDCIPFKRFCSLELFKTFTMLMAFVQCGDQIIIQLQCQPQISIVLCLSRLMIILMNIPHELMS